MKDSTPLSRKCIAEALGTFILVFFGIGTVHAAVLTGAQQGLWQVAVVWGAVISLAIYATGSVSGAHMNPAMTLSFAVFRGFPWRQVPWYVLSPLAGAILGSALYQYAIAAASASLTKQPEKSSLQRAAWEELDDDLARG